MTNFLKISNILKLIRIIISLYILIILLSSCAKRGQYDLIFRQGTIIDGTGKKGYTGDIAVLEERIIKIGNCKRDRAQTDIDATGMVICPGFVDLHAHLEPLPLLPDAASALHMGVTTALGGPDGSSPIHIAKYLDSLDRIGMGINVGYLIGHNSVRSQVLGMEAREPNADELIQMQKLIESAMRDGAFGMSTGLKYLPGAFSKVEEVISLATSAAAYGGIYTSHLREEGLGLFEGVEEAIRIAREADIPVVLTHHKAIGQPMWGKSVETLRMVDEARREGLDVMVDQYPYTASYTGLSVLIPPWSMEGGRYDKFAERALDSILRDSIHAGIVYNIMNDRGGGDLRRIQLARFNWKPELEGKTLYDWALAEGLEPTAENGADLIIEAQLHRGASAIYHAMSEEDVERIMVHPMTMIASDGRITEFEKGFPHPRVHGTFPRVLGHFSRDRGLMSTEEAIRKMTSLPAMRMGLSDRGTLRVGAFADMVIFDPKTIIDKATFQEPHQYPEGIEYVLVNGQLVLKQGQFFDVRNGKVLRKALMP